MTSLKTFKPKTTAVIVDFSSYINQMEKSFPTSDRHTFMDYFNSQPLSGCDTFVFPSRADFHSLRDLDDLSDVSREAPDWTTLPSFADLIH